MGWSQVEAGFAWDDLVLPESEEALLQSSSATLESGGRLRLLFTGGPGTGKTMACRILGARVDAPVLSFDARGKDVVDAAAAEELLRAAGRVGAVVVLDHADLLLRGRRPPRSTGGLDGAALLAQVRAHEGAVVFISTSTRAVKKELLEQFDGVVAFPFPDRHARKEIWRRLLPDDSELTDADIAHVADSFQLPGAAIHECCTLALLAAEAQSAQVTLGHVARALEIEYGDRLAGDSTSAALEDLRRRAGVEDDVELPPAPIVPPRAPSQRRRPAVRMPRLPARPRFVGNARRLRGPVLVAMAALVIAGAGFIAGRETSSHRPLPAAAKLIGVRPGAGTAARASAVVSSQPGATAPAPVTPASSGHRSTPYASALAGVIFPLHRTRTILLARLRETPSWSVAASQAGQLASAYTTAATQLRALDAGTAAGANGALADAFTQTASALSALRLAELHRSHSERLLAMAALREANRAGAAAYAELRRLGYRVPVTLKSSG